jgi:hypothetical protein
MIDTKNVCRAIDLLRGFSDQRKIIVQDIQVMPIPGSYLGGTIQQEDRIEIYCDMSYPESVREAVIVHEILHKILGHEGFPEVLVNETMSGGLLPRQKQSVLMLRSRFKSAIDHPEIFRRITSEFELDTSAYFDAQVQQKIRMFKSGSQSRVKEQQERSFQYQQAIMSGIEFFWYPNAHRHRILSVFRDLHPDPYRSCLSLYEKVKETGFGTPVSCYKSACTVKSHIIEYGESRTIGRLNDIWKALEIGKPTASSELEAAPRYE